MWSDGVNRVSIFNIKVEKKVLTRFWTKNDTNAIPANRHLNGVAIRSQPSDSQQKLKKFQLILLPCLVPSNP